jgi:hypothetical protein
MTLEEKWRFSQNELRYHMCSDLPCTVMKETVQSAANRWRYDDVPLHNNVAMMRCCFGSSEVRERV